METEKFEAMGPWTLSDAGGGSGKVNKRVVVTDMSNINLGKWMAETPSKTPVKVISSDIRTLRDRNSNGGRMIGFVRHTLGRRDSCQWRWVRKSESQKILTYLYLCARCSEIQKRLRMGKSKRGWVNSSLYTPGPLRLNIDLLLWYHLSLNSDWLPQLGDSMWLLRGLCIAACAAHCSRSIVLPSHVIKWMTDGHVIFFGIVYFIVWSCLNFGWHWGQGPQ